MARYRPHGALRWVLLCVLLLAGIVSLSLRSEAVAAGPPTDFMDTLVADVPSPTALAFTPDGRMLVATQPGKLRVYEEGALLASPALDLTGKVCTNSERGLLGIAIDPQFADNDFIYIYYTTSETGGCKNRVARYTLSDAGVATYDRVLIDGIPSPGGNHNGGDLHFGKDGYLYVSVGDGGTDYAGGGSAGGNNAARDPHVLLGKILRVDRNGGIPSANPNASTGDVCGEKDGDGRTSAGRTCKETFASGLRNPFRIAFDPDAAGTRFFINDVGQNAWEEIDEGRSGADYGWNVREGFCANGSTTNCRAAPGATVGGLTDPVHSYGRGIGASITGGAFVPDGAWPAEYDDSYLFADYVSGTIFRLELRTTGGGYDRAEFVTGMGSSSATSMTFGPHAGGQALYYTSYQNGGDVRRISYAGAANRPPTADVAATPNSGSAPLAVRFDGSGSSDPDGGFLTYEWDFTNDGTTDATGASASHTYQTAGACDAELTVRDGAGGTDTATVRIDATGNGAPTPKIEGPSASLLFAVGQEITLDGSATDPEDGTLPDGSLTWEVIRHHNNSHTHPFFSATGNNPDVTTFTAPSPEDLFATDNGTYLEIRLTATDSDGTSRTISQRLDPRRVSVTFKSLPKNKPYVEVKSDSEPNYARIDTPKTITSWEGYELTVNAPAQKVGRKNYVFASWSDGGAASHTITTPASTRTYTATFKR